MSSEFSSIILNALLNNHDKTVSDDMQAFIKNLPDAVILDILKASSEVNSYSDFRTHCKIIYILCNIGISYELKGFKYLYSAILKTLEADGSRTLITKHIYPGIAKQYNTLSSSVERNIRYAIKKAKETGNKDNLKKFGCSFTNLSNARLIYDITNYVRKTKLII